MEKRLYVKDIKRLEPGSRLTTPLLVLSQTKAETSKGSPYLSLSLGDITGKLAGKFWDLPPGVSKILKPGQICLISAKVDTYKDQIQLNVTAAESAAPGSYKQSDFLKAPAQSIDSMRESLTALIQSIGDNDLKTLTHAALNHPDTSGFWEASAAVKLHHAYPGGLLEHTLSVAKLAWLIAANYGPLINRDLLLCGAIVHDVGKCWEYSLKGGFEHTNQGQLLGHIPMGAVFIAKIASALPDFPADKLMVVQHMILSHHGSLDKGSPVPPKFIEAMILHHIDYMDAKVNGVSSFVEEETGSTPLIWTGFNWQNDTKLTCAPRWTTLNQSDDLTQLTGAGSYASAANNPGTGWPAEPGNQPQDASKEFGQLGGFPPPYDSPEIIPSEPQPQDASTYDENWFFSPDPPITPKKPQPPKPSPPKKDEVSKSSNADLKITGPEPVLERARREMTPPIAGNSHPQNIDTAPEVKETEGIKEDDETKTSEKAKSKEDTLAKPAKPIKQRLF
ncbi:MAG: HD domain-containing protein [Deltaproteobacteria bacterium]|jgi:3'-5' exoribonuclease|nr:HD domain-containing protein [Deltaproteobacteria bacterium]